MGEEWVGSETLLRPLPTGRAHQSRSSAIEHGGRPNRHDYSSHTIVRGSIVSAVRLSAALSPVKTPRAASPRLSADGLGVLKVVMSGRSPLVLHYLTAIKSNDEYGL